MVNRHKEKERLEGISAFYKKGDYMDELIIDREFELVQKYFNNRDLALEVGCGNGYFTAKLLGLFKDLHVLEGSSSNINLMKKRIKKNITVYDCLIEEFKTDKKYDNIMFLNVIEHVDEPVEILRKLVEFLSDEGLIFVSAPNCMSLNRRAGYKMGLLESYEKLAPKDIELGHRRLYTVNMLEEHCNLAGLQVLDIKGVYLKPLSEKQMFKLGDDVVRAFYALGEDIPEYCANLFAITKKKYY